MSMLEYVAKLKDLLPTLTTAHWFALSVLLGGLIWAPPQVLSFVALHELVQANRPLLAAALLISLVPTLGAVASAAVCWVKAALHRRHSRSRLHSLTLEEKVLLYEHYLRCDSRTAYFEPMDGVVAGLEELGVLYQARRVGRLQPGFAFNVSDWAWNYLKSHPGLLTEGLPPDGTEPILSYIGPRALRRS